MHSLGSAGKAESWPATHGGYPSDRKRSFGQRMKKSASARAFGSRAFLLLKKKFSGRSTANAARKRAPTPTRDLSGTSSAKAGVGPRARARRRSSSA